MACLFYCLFEWICPVFKREFAQETLDGQGFARLRRFFLRFGKNLSTGVAADRYLH